MQMMINSCLAASQGVGGQGGGVDMIKTYVGHEQFKKVKKQKKGILNKTTTKWTSQFSLCFVRVGLKVKHNKAMPC